MADTNKLLTTAILDKLRAKLPVSEQELQALQRHIDDLEQRRVAKDTHHHDTHGVAEIGVEVVRPEARA